MRIGIMQPYFFPYIGYFQLIHAVDTYVNLDHVSFMKRSYMTRNILKNNTSINIPVSGGSQNKSCKEVTVLADQKWFDAFVKTLETLYKKESNYNVIIDKVINPFASIFNGDICFGGNYCFGREIHPHEVLFIKTNRQISYKAMLSLSKMDI